MCVCLSVWGVWAEVVFPTGIITCTCTYKSWLLWVSNGGMACLSVQYIGAGGVR